MVKKYSGWNKMRLNYNTGYFKHNLYRNDKMWQMQETGGLWEDCPWVRLVTNSDSLGSEGPGEARARLPGSALHTPVQVQTDRAEAPRLRDGEAASQGEHSPSRWNTGHRQPCGWREGQDRQAKSEMQEQPDLGTETFPCPGGRWVKTVSAPPFFSRTICPTTTSSFFSPWVSLSLNTRTHTNSLWPSTCPHLLRLAY